MAVITEWERIDSNKYCKLLILNKYHNKYHIKKYNIKKYYIRRYNTKKYCIKKYNIKKYYINRYIIIISRRRDMRYPDNLRDNGRIGFVAPSFGCATEPYKSAFNNALSKFGEMGYTLVTGPNCYEALGIGISNTPDKCGKELTEYYIADNSDVIISCGGGELMCEILDYVDFDRISEAKPKWYMGYSDNTNFTFLLNTLCDTAAIYGPCAPAFGMEPWHSSLDDAYRILRGEIKSVYSYDMWEKKSLKDEEHPFEPYNVTERTIIKNYIGKSMTDRVEMSGRLLGGCVDCLVNLTGTSYDRVKEFADTYKEDGIIWFLECCDLNVMSIRRAMWHLKHSGWFKYTKGFIIGRPFMQIYEPEMMGLDMYDAVLEVIGEYNVPVIMDANIGHLAPMMPIISGACAKIESQNNNVKIDYEFR